MYEKNGQGEKNRRKRSKDSAFARATDPQTLTMGRKVRGGGWENKE